MAANIVQTADGTLRCVCGNVPESSGFDPCNASGVVDFTLLDATSSRPVHYLCNQCGAVSGRIL